jgi:8-oxo-dGTP diphosphatase
MATVLAANLIIRDGELLMLYRDDNGYWELPAGTAEDGELPRNAAVREAREEIGCDVRIRSSWGKFDLDFEHERTTYRTRGFISEIVDGEPEPQADRFSEMRWVGEQQLTDMALAPNLERIVPELRLLLKRTIE